MEIFKLVAVAVAGSLWLTWLVLRLQEAGVHPVRYVLDQYGRLGNGGKIVILFLVVQMTMFGGAKHGGTNDVDDVTGTNGVEIVEGGTNDVGGIEGETDDGDGFPPLMMARRFKSPSVDDFGITEGDIIRGYQLESIVTNTEISYVMPSDAVTCGTWHVRGAYEDVMKISFGDFRFPLESGLYDSLWAYTWGKVRPRLHNATDELIASGFPMSAVPNVSRLWTAAISNESYLLTWEDFFLGRDTNMPVNAQIEFHGNGDFITRFNDIEMTYRRVIQPNPITPVNPPDPAHPAMPVHPYGVVQNLSAIEEPDAYCWVDIVVDRADAWVRFEGDGPSNLVDPSFAAKAGETNRVIILIGKTYKVTCDMPFSVLAKSDPSIDERWEDSHTLWLNWPVSIWSRGNDEEPLLLLMGFGSGSHRGNGFTMHVSPSGLGGEFSWTNSCCAVSGSGLHFSYGCDGFCLCGGCSARGYYGYEGYRIGCSGGSCGCSWYDDDDRHGEDDPDDPEPTPGVSVSFSKSAVIFEDEYTNMPGQVVQWQSTTTKLTLEAHGGMKGGTATFTFTNKEKLIGPDIPTSISVPAGHCKTYEFTYRGNLPSGSEEDITVHGEFQESNPDAGSAPLASDAELTSIKVELKSVDEAVENPDKRRHVYGVAEEVQYQSFPSDATVSWFFPSGLLYWNATSFCCPWSSSNMAGSGSQIRVSAYGVSYDIGITVVDPIIQVQNPRVNANPADVSPVLGEAGHLVLYLDLYATPFYVSFRGVQIREVPDESQDCPHMGYYDDRSKGGNWSHTSSDGAGVWHTVGQSGFFASDRAGRGMAYQEPWIYGWKEWAIPMEWGSENNISVNFSPNPTTQKFTLEANGHFKIRKFNHEAERNIYGLKWLDGEMVW